MHNINGLSIKALELQKRADRCLKELYGVYQELSRESGSEFNEQLLDNKGKITGLEDFYQMTQTIKKNSQLIGSSLGILSKVGDISNFKITEESITR